MKILVFGAGIIGSYLAHILCMHNEVTILARGERRCELEKNGLVIRHIPRVQSSGLRQAEL